MTGEHELREKLCKCEALIASATRERQKVLKIASSVRLRSQRSR